MRVALRPNSLRFRLLASTVLLVLIVLPLTAFALTSYYRIAIEQTFDQRLKVHLDNLVAVSLRQTREHEQPDPPVEQQKPEKPSHRKVFELGEPLFKRPFSGWYWQISALDEGQNAVIVSDSLLDQRLVSLPNSSQSKETPGVRRGYIKGPEGRVLRAIEQRIIAGGTEGGEPGEHYAYLIAISSSELEGQVSQFRNMLFLALGLLGLGLILAGLVQVRYGLAPLSVISRKLNDIRAGKADRLQGDFPSEIKPLQVELNALIRSNKDIVERARTHVGNLAHALKTPLSVLANEIDKAKSEVALENKTGQSGRVACNLAHIVEKQTGIMNNQVRHHLDRARMAAQTGVIGSATSIQPITSSLSRTLQKIYKEKNIELICECGEELLFRGEKQDLEEMLGNLLDNAFKWAKSEVRLTVRDSSAKAGFFDILVEDDGPGLSVNKRQRAMQRGQRLDENLPGSGLGLSIVADLAHLYDGGFELEASKSGGLCARLRLPLVTG